VIFYYNSYSCIHLEVLQVEEDLVSLGRIWHHLFQELAFVTEFSFADDLDVSGEVEHQDSYQTGG